MEEIFRKELVRQMLLKESEERKESEKERVKEKDVIIMIYNE